MTRKYQLTEDEARMAHQQVRSHCEALKNWIIRNLEHGDVTRANELTVELREYQALFAKLNVDAHAIIDASR